MPRDLNLMVKSLERIRELSFKGGISETEIELRDLNMRIHQEASKALDAPLVNEEKENV